MESADTFHHVASTPPDDRNYYNLPPTNVNVADQDNYAKLSGVGNDHRTYAHLNTATGQWMRDNCLLTIDILSLM